MSESANQGIERRGLDTAFEADERRKSNLMLEGQWLSAQHQPDAAADCFAQAAEIEEHLADRCVEAGLAAKSHIHRLSAASCWARAGDFHTAIRLGDELLAHADLPPRLRQRVQEITQTLRDRRVQWSANLVLSSTTDQGE
jgi:hypothetical protein